MARPIDGNELKNQILHMPRTVNPDLVQYSLVQAIIANMPTLTPPNKPLTMGDAKKERYIWFTPLNDWAKVTPFGVLFFGSEELMTWETLCEEWGYRFKAYRRPPEGADAHPN